MRADEKLTSLVAYFQAHIPFQYAEPIFSGLMAAPFGPQSMVSSD